MASSSLHPHSANQAAEATTVIDVANDEDICVICRENFEQVGPHYLPDCYHPYHADCIIEWMRTDSTGRCPLCRAEPGPQLSCLDAFGRCSFLRRKARNVTAPRELKDAIAKLKKKEDKARAASKRFFAFRRKHRKMISELTRLRNRHFTTATQVHAEKRVVGLSNFPGIEVPLLPRSRRLRRRSRRRL